MANPSHTSPDSTRYWKFSPGASARHWEAFYQEGIMALSYDSYAFGDLHAYKDATALTQSQGLSPHSPVARSLMAFRDARIGDVVIAHQGRSQAIGVGIITGPYIYQGDRATGRHARTVDWVIYQGVPIQESIFPPDSFAPFRHWENVRKQYLKHFPELKAILLELERPAAAGESSADPDEGPAYTRADALKQLFLAETEFDDIYQALTYKQNLILQGPPGVGKTFLARQLAQCLIGRETSSRIEMVQFHPSYSYEDFIQGIRPQQEGGFTVTPGIFMRFCQKAQRAPEIPHVFIIDEVNRGHLSKIFGEVMLLLESDKRGPQHAIPLTYSRALSERFYIPQNLYVIGTMNTADRSLALVDYALRRRFSFISLNPQLGKKFQQYLKDHKVKVGVSKPWIQRLVALNRRIEADRGLGPGFAIGHSFWCQVPENGEVEGWFRRVVEWEIAPLLREYWFDDEDKAEQEIRALLG